VAVGLRLFYLQVVQNDFYEGFVYTQSSTNVVFTKDRGFIYDREGRVLASNRKVASLYTFGRNIEDSGKFLADLQANGIAVSDSAKKIITEKSGFVWLARHIDVARAEAIKNAVGNISYRLEDARFYPEGKMLSGLLGYTGIDNQGLEGVEYYAEAVLKGPIVPVSTKRDARGELILYEDITLKTSADSAVYLTMNLQMQAIAEKILKDDLAAFKARRGIAVAMDVATGDIIAAAYVKDPTFKDPFEGKNFISSYLFEPGSIFKAVSFAHLIESGLYRADHKVDVRTVEVHGHTIKDVASYVELTQKEIFTKSSNIGTVKLLSKVKRDGFYKFMYNSGFGHKIGVEGMAEEAGMLRDPKKWSGLSQASLSIGQEIMVTPLQIVRFYAAVANAGVAMRPNVVERYITAGRQYLPERTSERMMSAETAAILRDMMDSTVRTGTGRGASTRTVSVGGKTGTGQMIDTKTRVYSNKDYVASFAGIFPVDNPRVAMVVIYEAPRTSIYGGSTGASTFGKLAEQIAFFYNLGGETTKLHTASTTVIPVMEAAYAGE
jgi:cell division protein FtsI (penicillin-binding protein 3)